MKKAIVIGAGIAGLATCLRLIKKGYQVTVVEKNSYTGGKLHALEQDGYRFDLGPSLFTMPEFLLELFELHGENAEDYFKYIKKEVICNYFWQDGTRFSAPANLDTWIQTAAIFFNESEDRLRKYLEQSERKYNITAPIFIEKSLHNYKTYLSIKTLKGILNIGHLHIFKTLSAYHDKLFTNKKLKQYFNRFATYNGSSPFKTSAIMSMIPHLEMQKGTYFPIEGMHSISQSLYKLALKKGVIFLLNTETIEILVSQKKVIGVLIKETEKQNTKEIYADVVVSNSDVFNTYENLLPSVKTPNKIKNQERSSSGLIFYWGIKKVFPELDLHNIFFNKDYEEEFKAIFQNKTLPIDPTIYLNISSKEKPSDAPSGSENWFVMINAPACENQDWVHLKKIAKETILKKLSEYLSADISSLIETEYILDPIGIQQQTASHKGALYGTSSNNTFAAFLRQSNRASQIKNLYFCGGSAHPGGGIPLCLQSAKIVSQLIPSA